MKLIRSTKCSLKFATKSKIEELQTILTEYGKVCNVLLSTSGRMVIYHPSLNCLKI